MQTSNSTFAHILMTPWELRSAAREIFPDAEVKEVTSEGCVTQVEVSLSPSISPVRISTGVMRKKFVEEIDLLRVLIEADRITKTISSYCLNTANFTIQAPLRDWTEFRRKMYQASGATCAELIIDFLRANSQQSNVPTCSISSLPVGAPATVDDTQLRQCGLHPEQVEAEPSDADLAYFRAVIEKCQCLDLEDKRKVLNSFRNTFPCIYERIKYDRNQQTAQTPAESKPKNQSKHDKVYGGIFQELRSSITGQTTAVESLASFLAHQESSLPLVDDKSKSDEKWVFLFVGPPGTGKTALAEAVGKIKSDRACGEKKKRIVTFNMERFSDHSAGSLFFGVQGPDYQGAFVKPSLAEMLDEFATSAGCDGDTKIYEIRDVVILLDEFEKADSSLKQSMLNFFIKGFVDMHYLIKNSEIGSGQGKKVSLRYVFKNCVIIATSNLYEDEILQEFKTGKTSHEIGPIFRNLNVHPRSRLPLSFSGALMDRMMITPFGPISRGLDYQGIIKKEMELFLCEVKQKYGYLECSIKKEALVLRTIENILYGDGIGIRKVGDYFKSIYSQLDRHHRQDPTNEKLVFLILQDRFCFQTYEFDEFLCEYNARSDGPIPIEGRI